MDAVNPFLALSYPLLEMSLWFNERDFGSDEVNQIVELVHQRFDSFEHACQAQGLSISDAQNVKYALTALIDESALTSRQTYLSIEWQTAPLQLEFFGEHTAGEGFFKKLTELKQQANADVLEIYFLCLQLGFKGIYGMGQVEQLTAITVDLRSQLDGLRKETTHMLSVDPMPKDNLFQAMSKVIPLWVFSSIFICSIFVFYFGFSVTMDGRTSQSNKRVNAYYESHIKSALGKM